MIVNEIYQIALPGHVLVDGNSVFSTREPGKKIILSPGLHEFVIQLDGFKKATARLEHEVMGDMTVFLTRKSGIIGTTTLIKVRNGIQREGL